MRFCEGPSVEEGSVEEGSVEGDSGEVPVESTKAAAAAAGSTATVLPLGTWMSILNILADHVGIAWRHFGEEGVVFFLISIGDEHYGCRVDCCV
jgi:hypothetical protein